MPLCNISDNTDFLQENAGISKKGAPSNKKCIF